MYDPNLNQWSGVASLPSNTASPPVAVTRGQITNAVVAFAGKLYAIGGSPGGNTMDVYDPVANEWTVGNPMPYNR